MRCGWNRTGFRVADAHDKASLNSNRIRTVFDPAVRQPHSSHHRIKLERGKPHDARASGFYDNGRGK